jgi:hypothetical protein
MPHVVYLQHPRSSREWKLYETAEPHEITENYWRFRFSLEPKKVTAFIVKAQQTLFNYFALADITDQQLALWIDQKYLDAKTQKTLKQVIDLRQEAGQIDGMLKTLEKERTNIHNEQKRIRENLASLGDRLGEKELRERFIRTLNTQEDRLEQIDKEVQEKTKSRDACREKMNTLLAKLEYDAEV